MTTTDNSAQKTLKRVIDHVATEIENVRNVANPKYAETGEKILRSNTDRTPFETTAKDLWDGWQKRPLWLMLGYLELKRRYRRTKLGPFWGAAQNALYISCVGFVFTTLLDAERAKYIPFLTTGIVAWMFVYQTMQDASSAFVSASSLRQQLPFPYSMFIFQTLWRNLLAHAHNYILYLGVVLLYPVKVDWHLLLLIPGYILVLANLWWMTTLVATASARYRDVGQLTASIIQVMIFVTPIFYGIERLTEWQRTWMLPPNLLYHLTVVLRSPLLGETPPISSYITLVFTFIVGSLFTAWFFGRRRNKIVYWIM